MGGIVAEGGIGLSGIKLPGSVSAGLSATFSGSGVVDCADVDWLTFLKVSLAFLYACISARHAPDIDRIAERKKMARDWKEKECDDDARWNGGRWEGEPSSDTSIGYDRSMSKYFLVTSVRRKIHVLPIFACQSPDQAGSTLTGV